MNGSKTRILVVDDHSIVREGLRQLLNSQPDMTIVSEADNSSEALEKARALHPEVVILDITMPHLSGLDVLPLIKEAVPDTRIVVLSMHENDAYVYQALASGALGYILKASPSTEILTAIRAACKGEYYLSSKLNAEIIGSYLKNRKTSPSALGYDLLSEKEQQVFRLVVQGKTTNQMAELLCVSPKTVEKHRSSISRKLDIHNVVDMVKYAIKIGLISPEI